MSFKTNFLCRFIIPTNRSALALIIILLLFSASLYGQAFTDIGAPLPSLSRSAVAWGDYDNDGDLDILLTGEAGLCSPDVCPISKVYRNHLGNFTDINASLPGVYNPEIVTSPVFSFYEHKLYLKSDRTSCTDFSANQFRLFLHSAAYVLIHALKTNILQQTPRANATIATIRLRLFKIGARVRQLKTRIKVELPSSFPLQTTLVRSFQIFALLLKT